MRETKYTYGGKIKKYLDDNGIKYSFVAEKAGMPLHMFSAILNGRRKITVEEYFNICTVLRRDVNYFFNG